MHSSPVPLMSNVLRWDMSAHSRHHLRRDEAGAKGSIKIRSLFEKRKTNEFLFRSDRRNSLQGKRTDETFFLFYFITTEPFQTCWPLPAGRCLFPLLAGQERPASIEILKNPHWLLSEVELVVCFSGASSRPCPGHVFQGMGEL